MKERIVLLIEKLGLTQKKFAEQIGITAGGLTDFLKGRSKDLSSSTVASIYKKYNVNPTWLLTGEGEMFINNKPDNFKNEEAFDAEFMEYVITIVTRMLRAEKLELQPEKFAKLILYLYNKHKDEIDDDGGIIDKEIKEDVVLLKNFM